jgi:acetyl esterase/lipase
MRDLYGPNITETILGGINVLDIKPKGWLDNGKVLVYTHGGGYKIFSANSTLSNSVLASNSTGLRVISINYTVAPFSKWNQTTDEVISVIQALKDEEGYSSKDIAIYGESAGGGLAAGSVLKMRDNGMDMPAAVVLWSPSADVTSSGDTYYTLRDADLYSRYYPYFVYALDAYADEEDQKNPYVSPVYGNFSKGFPPTLIQCGTKESLLSDSVRLYQALDQADKQVKLDIYEGMPHVFQSLLINTTESDIALSKMNDFLRLHLDYR